MKLEHARERVLDLWRSEYNSLNKDDYIGFFQAISSFYDRLIQNNSELLTFNCLGDKWQIINRWIHEYEEHYNS